MSNDKEREALDVAMSRECVQAWDASGYTTGKCDAVHPMFAAAFERGYRASLAASAGSTEINGQLYTALNNLFSHLGMEGCVTSDHAFVWDAMTALKRIDGGVHLDNLAVPVDPDAHRDDMLAAVRLLEAGEWAEHFAKTPIGMRLEDQMTKLHNEVAASAGIEPVAKERFSEPLSRVIHAGYALSNCAFNLAQKPGEVLTPAVAETLSECRKEWDAACAAFKAHPSPPEGMVMVPKVPTNAMASAGANAVEDPENERSSWDLAENLWREMIAAAPPLAAGGGREAG